MTFTNLGGLDRTLRIIAGIVLLGMVFYGPETPWGWVGVVPLVTGLIGNCPAYALFGWSTCKLTKSGA